MDELTKETEAPKAKIKCRRCIRPGARLHFWGEGDRMLCEFCVKDLEGKRPEWLYANEPEWVRDILRQIT